MFTLIPIITIIIQDQEEVQQQCIYIIKQEGMIMEELILIDHLVREIAV
jgi:hypothetical protein